MMNYIKKIFTFIGLLLTISIMDFNEINAQIIFNLQLNFLNNHFVGKEYEVWKEKLIIEGIDFTTAVHYVHKEKRIFDDAVVFTVMDDKIIPYLYFVPDKILDGKKMPIIDLSIHPYDFYGWQMEYSIPKNKEYSPGFNTTSFADGGRRVTDGPTIQWNSSKKCFEEVVFKEMWEED